MKRAHFHIFFMILFIIGLVIIFRITPKTFFVVELCTDDNYSKLSEWQPIKFETEKKKVILPSAESNLYYSLVYGPFFLESEALDLLSRIKEKYIEENRNERSLKKRKKNAQILLNFKTNSLPIYQIYYFYLSFEISKFLDELKVSLVYLFLLLFLFLLAIIYLVYKIKFSRHLRWIKENTWLEWR